MPDWFQPLVRGGARVEDRLDGLKLRLRARTGRFKQIQMLPYHGFGNSEFIWVRGRVLKDRPGSSPDQQRTWHNVLATYRRLHSVEVPNVPVRIIFGNELIETFTDEEGYFEAHIRNSQPSSADPWREISFQATAAGKASAVINGKALVPSAQAKFGIISDIDDTILVTNAPNLARAARNTFLRGARGRVAFPGVAAFYRALQAGASPGEFNPIFYVSSGPWNLYDLLIDFMAVNDIPAGPILLQDYGLEENRLFSASHSDHKMAQIAKVLQTYPHLPFILIGDSGQHDPEIYRKVLEEVPNRIKAIYIRNVTAVARTDEIRKLSDEAKKHGGEILLVQDSAAAARDALSKNWITAAAFEEIQKECSADKGTK